MMRSLQTDKAIAQLATCVLDCTLPRPQWTHAAHFALALWCIRHRPGLAAPEAFRRIIRRLNDFHGTPNTDNEGYHHTITIASLRAARSILASHGAKEPLHRVLANLVAGPYGRSDWIFAFWSRELLFGLEARRGWVEPDLAALPF